MMRLRPFGYRGWTRFDIASASLSVTLLLATVVVLSMGDRVGLLPAEVSPAPGAVAASTLTPIRVRFDRPMDTASVETRFTIEPATPGTLRWLGNTLVWLPATGLQPATTYTVGLQPGVADRRGRSLRETYRWSFTTGSPSVLLLQRAGGTANVVWLDPARTTPRWLTTEDVDVVDFRAGPDGKTVAYTRQDSPVRTTVWSVALETGQTTRLSPDEPANFAGADWSPDGSLVVFERRLASAGQVANPKLHAAHPDGTPAGLVYGRGDEVGFGARWSPNGGTIAFLDPVGSTVGIFQFRKEVVRIPVQTTVTFAWSPDSRRLAVEDIVGQGAAYRHSVSLAAAADGTAVRITGDREDDSSPTWSPDGTRLATVHLPDGAASPEALVRDLASGQRRTLDLPPRAGRLVFLTWSPADGRLLAVTAPTSANETESHVWLLDADGRQAPVWLARAESAAWLP